VEYLEVPVSNEDHQSYYDSILVIFMLIYMREKIAMDNSTILKFEQVMHMEQRV